MINTAHKKYRRAIIGTRIISKLQNMTIVYGYDHVDRMVLV